MPIYDFKCLKCEKEFEERFSTFAEYEEKKATTFCPECEGPVEKQISRKTSFILKGSGYHATDYGKRGRRR